MAWHDPDVLIPAGIAGFAAWNTCFFGVLKYFFNRQMKTIDDKMETVNTLDRRLIEVETILDSRPQCKSCGENQSYYRALHARIDAVASKVDKVDGSLDGLKRAVDLMNEFLIQQGAR